jgi:hypothetical protein
MASQFQYGPDNTLRMLATFTGPDKEKNKRRVQKQFEKYDVNRTVMARAREGRGGGCCQRHLRYGGDGASS